MDARSLTQAVIHTVKQQATGNEKAPTRNELLAILDRLVERRIFLKLEIQSFRLWLLEASDQEIEAVAA